MYEDVRYKDLDGPQWLDSVYVYGLSYCDHCKDAIRFLEDQGVGLRYVYLDRIRGEIRKRVADDLEARRGEQLIYPILEVDGKYYFGFEPAAWRDAIGVSSLPGQNE
jgi:glutaredoxin-like protein NrdH